jgi:predicted dienelactone hydrolase
MGHSQGGLSSLLLAGAPLQAELLRQQCQSQSTVQLNGLLQCQLVQQNPNLPSLKDSRIVAALPISPSVRGWLDQTAIGQIQIPTMIVAAGNDIVTPILTDQVQPFTWLTTPDRYLTLVENATHLSPLTEDTFTFGDFQLPPGLVGPEPKLMRQYLQVLSTAFFQTYSANQPTFRPYLSAAYARQLSQDPLPLSLVQQLW